MTVAKDNGNLLRTFYEQLEQDINWRNKFIALLNPDYVHRDELTKVLEELKKQREDSNKRFEQLITNMNKRFEESNKRYEELREDMNRRFEAIDKRFEESNKRYEELREDMNRRFEAVDKRFEQLIAGMNKRFDKVFARLDDLSRAFGHDFEEFNSYWLETFLIELGYPRVKIEKKIFVDENYEVFPDSKDVEIDLFNSKPLVIGEVTAVTRTIDKVTLFLRKVSFIERKLGSAKYKLFITYTIEPSIRDEAIRLLSQAGVDVILVSRHRVIKAKENKKEEKNN